MPAPLPQAATCPAPAPVSNAAGAAAAVVEKRGPETITPNQPYAYEIILRNPGNAAVGQVRVEDELPPGARLMSADPPAEVGLDRLTWSMNSLESGAERHIKVQLNLGAITEYHATATIHYTATATLRTRAPQPRLTLTMRGPEQVMAGDNVPFQIQIANAGGGPISNLVLHGNLPDGLTHPQGKIVEAEIGTLQPGESRNVTLMTQAVKGGQFVSEMTATADGGIAIAAKCAIQVQGPTLQLQRNGPAKCVWKSELGFELDVANCGVVPAGYVEVGDTLAPGLEFVSASDGGRYDPANRTILWRLPALPAGAHQKVGYRVKAVGVGELPDRAAARCDRGPDVKADGTITVEGIPAIGLEVVDLEDPVPVGGELTYEIRVVNQGSCPCTNIQIVAQVPDGLLPRDGSGPTTYRANGADVVFEPLAKLATKADAVYRVKVRCLQPGDYRFRVQMTCDQLRQPVMKEEASRVYKVGP
jgi:uncharacterized repeat protein (TIGR01451 family)